MAQRPRSQRREPGDLHPDGGSACAVLRQSTRCPAAITALAPERWCTIEASTNGGLAPLM
jgi:hypothetical protein